MQLGAASVGRIKGLDTVRSHSYAWLSDVQRLSVVENRQSNSVSASSQAVLVCFTLKTSRAEIAFRWR